jgi:hypothetical protein
VNESSFLEIAQLYNFALEYIDLNNNISKLVYNTIIFNVWWKGSWHVLGEFARVYKNNPTYQNFLAHFLNFYKWKRFKKFRKFLNFFATWFCPGRCRTLVNFSQTKLHTQCSRNGACMLLRLISHHELNNSPIRIRLRWTESGESLYGKAKGRRNWHLLQITTPIYSTSSSNTCEEITKNA